MNQDKELEDQIYRFPHPNTEGRLCRPMEVVQKKIIRLRSSLSLQTPPSVSSLKHTTYLEKVAALLASNIAGQEGQKTYLEYVNMPPPDVQPKSTSSNVQPAQDKELIRVDQEIKKFADQIQKMQKIADGFNKYSQEKPTQQPIVPVSLFSSSQMFSKPSSTGNVFNLHSNIPQQSNNLVDQTLQPEIKPLQDKVKTGGSTSTNASLFASKPPTNMFCNPNKTPIFASNISANPQKSGSSPQIPTVGIFQTQTPLVQPNPTNIITLTQSVVPETTPIIQIPSFFNPTPEVQQEDKESQDDDQDDQDDLDEQDSPQKKEMDFKDIKYTGVLKMFDNSVKEPTPLFSQLQTTPAVSLFGTQPKPSLFSLTEARDPSHQPSIFATKTHTVPSLFCMSTGFLNQSTPAQMFKIPVEQNITTVTEPVSSGDGPLKVPQITSLQTNQVVARQKSLFGHSPLSNINQQQSSTSTLFGSGLPQFQKSPPNNIFGAAQTHSNLFSTINQSGGLFASSNTSGLFSNIFSQAEKLTGHQAANNLGGLNSTGQAKEQEDSGDDLPMASDQPEIVEGQMHCTYTTEMETLIKREANLYRRSEEQAQYFVLVSLQKPLNSDKKYLIVRSKQTKVTIYTALILPNTNVYIMSNKAMAKIAPVLPVLSNPDEKLSLDSIRIKFNDLQSSQCFKKVLETGSKE